MLALQGARDAATGGHAETVAVCTEVPVKDWVSVLTPLLCLHWALSLAHTPQGTRVAVLSLGLPSGLPASRAKRMNACVGHGSVVFYYRSLS